MIQKRLRLVSAALSLAGALSYSATATAQTAKPPAQTDLGANAAGAQSRPWAKAISPTEQKLATDLFREGNGLLKESLFVQAAAKYREALAHWDHPGIHYNLALALLNLDQPVEVFTQLEEAMKYGAQPLDQDKFEHAGRYKALIEKQLARLEVTCYREGAEVSLDGRTVFTAPGRYEALVRVGQHTIVATKTGFVTTQKTPTLPPGVKTTIDLQMFTAEDLTQYKRRWKIYMPYSILATGIVVAGIGGILHWQASQNFNAYDSGVTSCSMGSANGGCKPDGNLSSKQSLGTELQAGAYVAYALGGLTAVAGATLAYLNRARPVRVDTHERDKVTVAPVIAPGRAGATLTVNF